MRKFIHYANGQSFKSDNVGQPLILYAVINNPRKLWLISRVWNVCQQWEAVAPSRRYRAASCVTSEILSQLSSSWTNFLDPLHDSATYLRVSHSRYGTARFSVTEIWHNFTNRYILTNLFILWGFTPLYIFWTLFFGGLVKLYSTSTNYFRLSNCPVAGMKNVFVKL